MKVILISIGIFQEYINTNIKQLLDLDYEVILITEKQFFDNVLYKDKIILENSESYKTNFDSRNKLNTTFRNGFWKNTSKRLFVLYTYLKTKDYQNTLHIENDILLYKNISTFQFENKLHLTMDSPNRCIPGIIYIPNYTFLEPLITHYNYSENDMVNMATFYNKNKSMCKTFPIIKKNKYFNKKSLYFKYFDIFEGIFDAAAMGQYLGGIDPKNKPGNAIGFINETCLVKYNVYKFIWKEGKPYIKIDGKEVPIYNLHIHCKNLKKFTNM